MSGGVNTAGEAADHGEPYLGQLVRQAVGHGTPVVRTPARPDHGHRMPVPALEGAQDVEGQRRVVNGLQPFGILVVQRGQNARTKFPGRLLFRIGVHPVTLGHDVLRKLFADPLRPQQFIPRRLEHGHGGAQGFGQRAHPDRSKSFEHVQGYIRASRVHAACGAKNALQPRFLLRPRKSSIWASRSRS